MQRLTDLPLAVNAIRLAPATVSRAPRAHIAVSVAAHLAVGAMLCLVVLPRLPPAPPPQISIPVVFATPLQPAPTPSPPLLLAAAALAGPQPMPDMAPLAPIPAVRAQVPLPRPSHQPVQPHPRIAPASVSPAIASVAASPLPQPPARPAPAPATSSAADRTALAALESRIHQAVQDAVIYPAAARLLHRQGHAQVRFDYRNGDTSGVEIVATSQSRALDAAALLAIRHAAMPKAPADIGDRTLPLVIWVDFTLQSQG